MGFIQEFKTFISRGNVMDMAVGVIIGGAFSKIVNSLVKDLIMPLVGYLTGGIDFTDKTWVIRAANEETGVPELAVTYGQFIQVTIEFLIIAFSIFCLLKVINKFMLKKKEEEAPAPAPAPEPEPSAEEKLLAEILAELKKKN